MMLNRGFKGVIPPMLTPFKENGDVDYDGHVRNMERWNETALNGYLVLGSNSETPYLNEQEKIRLVELTVRHAKKGRVVLAGTGLESARETIALTNRIADLGVHGALILTPAFYHEQMGEEAQIGYFEAVADHARIPILIYNVSKFTHINLSARAVEVLSRHPNIVGMKDSNGNIPQLVTFQRVMSEDFLLMAGTASVWYPALTLGVGAGIFALANCLPNECALVQKAYEEGDMETAQKTYRRIFPVNTAVTATFGVAGLKYASELKGYDGGAVRNPMCPLREVDKEAIRAILETAERI